MQMGYGEIVRSYKEAKEPKKQIGILAELNAVGKDEIAKILYDAGEISKMTYGQYQRHGKKAVNNKNNTDTSSTARDVSLRETHEEREVFRSPSSPAGEGTGRTAYAEKNDPHKPTKEIDNVHVPEAVIEMVKDTLAELKSAYGNAKKVVMQYEEMEAFLAAATADKTE